MLSPRDYLFGADCRQKIFEGVELIYSAVSSTLGPNGRTVLIDRNQVVQVTKDGVSVAEEVKAKDRWQEIGVKIVKEASQNTNLQAGDGTTTAVVLSREMCKQALELPHTANVIRVKRGMKKAVDACTDHLEKISKKVKTKQEFKKVAFISSQDEEIAEIVTDAFMGAGQHGSIEIERADEPVIEVEKTEGLSFGKGWMIPACINDLAKKRAVMEDCAVLVTDKEIKHQNQLVPLMEALAEKQVFRLLVIADNVAGDALGMIAANLQQKAFFCVPVKAPSFGNDKVAIMQDICAATGAKFISEEHGGKRIERATIEDLGKAKKAIVSQDKTIIMSDDNVLVKKSVSDRIDFIKSQITDAPIGSLDRELLEKRLATLTDGICVLKVGGQTEVERHERKHRVEDAVRALKSASEEGVTPGCGVALLRCVHAVDEVKTDDKDERAGIEIVRNALHSVPLRVLEVAHVRDREWIVGEIKNRNDNTGYDFNTGTLGDMMELGIWDAKKAVRCALQNAAATAQTFLSVDVAMSDIEDNALEQFTSKLKAA